MRRLLLIIAALAFVVRPSDAAPGVVSVTPTNAATGVSATAPVIVTFSEAMNPSTRIFLQRVSGADPEITGVVMSVGNTVATVSHSALVAGATYKVHVVTDGPTTAEWVQAAGFTVAP